MRNFILTLGLILSVLLGQGQNYVELDFYSGENEITAHKQVVLKPGFNIPSGQNVRIHIAKSSAQNKVINALPSGNRNFVLVRDFKIPGVVNETLSQKHTVLEENQTVTYYDNFGRAIQQTGIMTSSSFTDVIQPITYDQMGKKNVTYLPFSDNNRENGSFMTEAVSKQSAFYGNSSWDPYVAKTTAPYSITIFDNSPQSRVVETGGVGVVWQPGLRSVRYGENYNNNLELSDITTSRRVRCYSVNTIGGALETTGYYGDNELKVSVTKNSNWKEGDEKLNTTEVYFDKLGNKILVRTFFLDESNNLKFLSHYSVYSELGELSYILPPVLNPDEGNITVAGLDKYGYKYVYDVNGRLISEKAPGIGPTLYIYNGKGQLVALQTPNQKNKSEWTFSKYDRSGRTIISGVTSSTKSYEQLSVDVLAHANTFEEKSANGLGYTNTAWPIDDIVHYNNIAFYDSYEIAGLPPNLQFEPFNSDSKVDYPSGFPTAIRSYTENSQSLWSVNYYNMKGELLQTQSTNHLGGKEVSNNSYSFSGEAVSNVRKHITSNNTVALEILNSYEYDHVGKLLKLKQRINNQDEIILASFDYDDLGNLVDKKLHQKAGQSKYLQSIDYRYNEKGWLKSINDSDLLASSVSNDGDFDSNADLFGLKLSYEDDPIEPQYNGNIASLKWKTSRVPSQNIAPPKMGYQFRYDALNRMTNSLSEKNGVLDNGHNESVSYDLSGNIKTLKRGAEIGGSQQLIDDLVYSYDGYRTLKIDDLSSSSKKELGYEDKVTLAEEYLYDDNGNVIEDKNKGIALKYTDSGLIKEILFNGKQDHKLEFLYDRSGQKLQAKYTYPNGSYTIDYLDGIQYQKGQIAFIHTPEGRARWNGSRFLYEYDIKDHLGNVRVTFRANPSDQTETTPEVLQQNSYYPYGLPMYGDSENGLHLAFVSGEKSKYLYSGKELYDQGGLNWFDHGSRMYDPAIGRWSAMDPAQQFANPYLAMGNNPAMFVDPNGEWIHLAIGAAVGGMVNWIANGAQLNAKGLGYFGVGAVAGALTAGVGAGVSSALAGGSFGAGFAGSSSAMAVGTGFMSSSVVGASAGGAGGFASGFGNSMVGGSGYSSALGAGAISGGWGALTGGVFGGIAGGINARNDGRNFWTGGGAGTEQYISPSGFSSKGRYSSRQEMERDYNNLISSKDGVSLAQVQTKLNTFVDLEVNPAKLTRGGLIITKHGNMAGVTSPVGSGGFSNKVSSVIRIAPAVKGYNLIDKNGVFKHEFVHAYHFMKGFSNIGKYTEAAASGFSRQYYLSFGLPVNSYIKGNLAIYPSSFSWENVNKLVPLWLP